MPGHSLGLDAGTRAAGDRQRTTFEVVKSTITQTAEPAKDDASGNAASEAAGSVRSDATPPLPGTPGRGASERQAVCVVPWASRVTDGVSSLVKKTCTRGGTTLDSVHLICTIRVQVRVLLGDLMNGRACCIFPKEKALLITGPGGCQLSCQSAQAYSTSGWFTWSS